MLIDTHTHLYAEEFNSDRNVLIEKAIHNGISKFYLPNIDSSSIAPMLSLESHFPKNCFAMMGLHPCHVKNDVKNELIIISDWLKKREFVAIGEIGMDLYWDKTNLDRQLVALEIQVEWAKAKELPIVLHCRESIDLTIEFIENTHNGKLKGIFHCFTGTLDQAKRIVEMGFLLGIGGVSTYKNGGLDQVIPYIGLEHLVLETDAPYLAPVPYRGKRNESFYLIDIAKKLAELKQVSLKNVADITTENSKIVFGI